VAVLLRRKFEEARGQSRQLAKLADPRTLQMNAPEADKVVAQAGPVYYITGTIHSTETGAPTALMEVGVPAGGGRQRVRQRNSRRDDHAHHSGGGSGRRDRMVDIYKWHLAHPKDFYPPLVYWGNTWRTTIIADAMGRDAEAHRKRDDYVRKVECASAARFARVGAVSLRQHDRRWSVLTRGSTQSWRMNGR